MPDPKYPQSLATTFEVDSNSSPEERDREGHIMSVSKSFAGATAALMATDGKFGEKKMNATLLDILQEAENKHPERIEEITKYREMIAAKGCGDVTMSELLSHRSGLIQGDSYFEVGKLSSLEVFKSDDLLDFKRDKKGKFFSYCNPAFVLAEDMMSLASDSQEGYYGELKDRIIRPLDLKHTKSVYESEEAIKASSDDIVIEGVIYDYGVKAKKTKKSNFLNGTQKGNIALSEGGLCSSVNDLETFYGELAKIACGIPSKLTPDREKAKEVHGFYRDAYNAGENCESGSKRGISAHAAKHYSLGTFIQIENGFDMKTEVSIPSRGNEDKKISFWHIGDKPSGKASVSATMPFSFREFTQGTAKLEEGEEPELKSFIKQTNSLAQDSLLTMVSCDYIKKIDNYFSGKCNKKIDDCYNDIDLKGNNWRTYNQYWEAARNDGYVAKKWQSNLIHEHRLPENFGEFHDEIREAYKPARDALHAYVIENYLDENGVIDSKKIDADFKTAADFERVREEVLKPHLEEAHKKTEEILARSDEAIKIMQEKRAAKITENEPIFNALEVAKKSSEELKPEIENSPNLEALDLSPKHSPDKQSWVERVTEKGKTRDDSQITAQDAVGAEELWANRVSSKSAKDNSSHSLSS